MKFDISEYQQLSDAPESLQRFADLINKGLYVFSTRFFIKGWRYDNDMNARDHVVTLLIMAHDNVEVDFEISCFLDTLTNPKDREATLSMMNRAYLVRLREIKHDKATE